MEYFSRTTSSVSALVIKHFYDDQVHGSGRRVENASEGVTIQITKTTDSAGILNIYLYVLMDAQLNIEDGRFVSALYSSRGSALPIGPSLCDYLRNDGVRQSSVHTGPAGGPLLQLVSTHFPPAPDRTVQAYQKCPWIWSDPYSKYYFCSDHMGSLMIY